MKLQSIILLSTFVVLSSCTREAPDMSRVSLHVPKTDAIFAKGLQIQATQILQDGGMSKWALPAPQNFNEINCFAVMVHVPDMTSAEPNSCNTFGAATVASPHIIKGGFLSNTNQTVEVPSGYGRTIYLVGFHTDSDANCIDLAGNTAADRFHSDKFSPPMIISQATVDLEGGDVAVNLSVPSTLTDSMKFEDCSPALFSKDVAPTEPTALVSAVPAFNNLSSITFSVSGSYVYEYSSALVSGALGSCAGAAWSAFDLASKNTMVTAPSDGDYTFCVKARSASGKEQTNPTMVSWTRDTQIPATRPIISFASPLGNDSTPFLTVSSWPVDAAKIEIFAGFGCTMPIGTKTKAEAETGLTLALGIDQTYTFYARYLDAADNSGSCTSVGASYTLDREGPSAPLSLSPRAGTSLEHTPYFTWDAASDVGLAGIDRYQVAYSDDPAVLDKLSSWASGGVFYSTYMMVSPFLLDGKDYYFSVRAVDKAGNFGAISTQKFTVNMAAQWQQQAFIKASDAAVQDKLGNSVAIDADTMVVGSAENGVYNTGAAYVYKRSGNTWTEIQKLLAPDIAPDDLFGSAVAISGDTIAVSAPWEDGNFNSVQNAPVTGFGGTGATNSGAVYVFRKVGGFWVPEAYIKAPSNIAYGSFGTSLAIVGNTLVVGAKNMYTTGSAFVFERTGSIWSFRQTLLPVDPPVENFTDHAFGTAVSFDGLRIAVGAPGKALGEGAVYIYHYSGAMWAYKETVQAGFRSSSDRFGHSLQIFGNRLVVGAPGEDGGLKTVSRSLVDDDSVTDAGAAYIFQTDAFGNFVFDSYLKSPSNWGGYEEFGTSVALFGTTVVVAAPYEDNCAQQQVFSDQTVQQIVYGSCLNSGAIYVYQLGSDNNYKWSTYAKPTYNDSTISTIFGYSVAISGSSVVVGAPNESSDTKSVLNGTVADSTNSSYISYSGAVYLFDVYDAVPQDPQIQPAPATQGPPPLEITPIGPEEAAVI